MSQIQSLTSTCKASIAKHLFGKDDVIEKVLATIISGGHVLLNDVPGTGKTLLARQLAISFGGKFHRIQFTPDLLPGDITGVSIFDPKTNTFLFQKGPVFSNILLADEINRATPRTQSALLECMEEHQVSVDGTTYPLEEPFFVIATQNPVEMQGTFPLPEAQLDRFMLCLTLGYPNRTQEMAILTSSREVLKKSESVISISQLLAAQKELDNIKASDAICEYVVDLAEATRSSNNISLGLSTRGMLALLKISKATAAIRGRNFVTPDDIKWIAVDCIAHRLVIHGSEWDDSGKESREIVQQILERVPVPRESTWN
ncbi:MAG: MoxR family ATPase [Ruminococcus sp.]|nr:MoxR family ATPase [Ruminococcus sp.]